MSVSLGTGGNSSPGAAALGQVLVFFGSAGDFAAGCEPDAGERVASLAVALARLSGLSSEECDALYFAARLRNAGVLANPAYARGEDGPERLVEMHRWDVPAAGARLIERFAALPPQTADIVRWQSECWDGTGFPDQLRWGGVPTPAQLLHLASAFVAAPDPEEALASIVQDGGRRFAPEQTRTFVMWFHACDAEIEPVEAPYQALRDGTADVTELLALLAERVDAHNGTPGRAKRIRERVEELATALDFDAATSRAATLGALLFGVGELQAGDVRASDFDPLARLGNRVRATQAAAAADLASRCEPLAELAPVLRARAEWYDGTGEPDALRHGAIPRASHALGVCIAFDAIDEAYRSRVSEERTLPIARLETAAGTQFDPDVVRALGEIVKARA